MIPPLLLRVALGPRRLWIPLFLLWPVWLVLGMLYVPLVLVLLPFRRGRLWARLIFAAYRALCALRGLHVGLGQDKFRLHLRIY